MVNEWIEPIYNRTYANVQSVMNNPNQENPIGCYNLIDPNRVENNTAYVLEYMLEHKIIRVAPSMRIKTNWQEDEIIVASEMKRIVENVAVLCSLSNPMIQEDLPTLYLATQVNYVLANDIERALDIMHDQPELPIAQFQLTLNDGLIISVERLDGTVEMINANTCFLSENEVARITSVIPGPDPEYKVFTNWSGDTDDLQYIGNVLESTTTFVGQYHDVEFTANFRSTYPRQLVLTNGYISVDGDDKAESGPTSGTYYAGNDVMIIADIAPSGKAFYCWEGTQEALDAISTAKTDPSTVWLTMPDCDVELRPKYVNAGQHYVTVTNGTGSGWYNYGESVNISANVPTNYGFDNWSGDTGYLDDIYSSGTSFNMPDVGVSLRANYSYRYGYYNVDIVNGLINGETSVQGARESSSLPLTATPPNESYGLDYWSVEGAGSAGTSYFYVGRGDATITGHYAPYHTLTIKNLNNSGDTTTKRAVEGHSYGSVTTDYSNGNYYFRYWEENGESISTNRTLSLSSSNVGDRTVTAVYEYVEPTPTPVYTYYDVKVINQNNSGATTTTSIREGYTFSRNVDVTLTDYILTGYYVNGSYTSVDSTASTARVSFTVNANSTVEFTYRDRNVYKITVENKDNLGNTTITDYKENSTFSASTSVVLTDYILTGYSRDGTYTETNYNTSSVSLSFTVRANSTIRYVYRARETRRLVVNNGTGSGLYKERTSVAISANTLGGYRFRRWGVTSGSTYSGPGSSSNTSVTLGLTDVTVLANFDPIVNVTVITNSGTTTYQMVKGQSQSISSSPYPNLKEFGSWSTTSGDATFSNYLSSSTYVYAQDSDSTVEANYKDIPWYNINVINGYVQLNGEWVESGQTIRGSYPNIHMKPAPDGYQFLQWEVVTGNQSDVYQPLAETTRLNSVYHDITIRATYYIPDPDTPRTLTIIQKDGTVETYNNPVGAQVHVYAQSPDEGYRFFKWERRLSVLSWWQICVR